MKKQSLTSNPDASMWSAGCDWRGNYFQMSHFPRIFCFDASGLWSYPAFIENNGEVCWLHIMLPTESLQDKSKLLLFAPRCIAITPVNCVTLLEYKNLSGSNAVPWKDRVGSIGQYPWKGIGSMTLREYSHAESDLMLSYKKASLQFSKSKTLPSDFINNYQRINHPLFLQFLSFFAPDFLKALSE